MVALHPLQPDLVYIPQGAFIMGSIPSIDDAAFDDEVPIHAVSLADYYIGRYPVTSGEYEVFLGDTGHAPPNDWKAGRLPPKLRDRPVCNVSLYDAIEYCLWLSQRLSRRIRLPSEAEWEKAARGPHAFVYPWGYKWQPGECNTSEAGLREATPVDQFVGCPSPYGVVDMCGNVGEWTITLWESENGVFQYPYDFSDGRESQTAPSSVYRVIRGGSFLQSGSYARCAARGKGLPSRKSLDVGFRIASDP